MYCVKNLKKCQLFGMAGCAGCAFLHFRNSAYNKCGVNKLRTRCLHRQIEINKIRIYFCLSAFICRGPLYHSINQYGISELKATNILDQHILNVFRVYFQILSSPPYFLLLFFLSCFNLAVLFCIQKLQ